jgi:hypothetical protein
VSVSRRAGPPHFGQEVFTKSGMAASGDSPVPESQLPVLLPDVENYRPSGTGTSPQAGQWTIGIGAPQ